MLVNFSNFQEIGFNFFSYGSYEIIFNLVKSQKFKLIEVDPLPLYDLKIKFFVNVITLMISKTTKTEYKKTKFL